MYSRDHTSNKDLNLADKPDPFMEYHKELHKERNEQLYFDGWKFSNCYPTKF